VELEEYSVKRIRKALTGNGNASKVQTRGTVANLLNIDEAKLVLDASDALALALGYVRMQGLRP
jgi:crossover junction endodeoxyribonuclease RuvC